MRSRDLPRPERDVPPLGNLAKRISRAKRGLETFNAEPRTGGFAWIYSVIFDYIWTGGPGRAMSRRALGGLAYARRGLAEDTTRRIKAE